MYKSVVVALLLSEKRFTAPLIGTIKRLDIEVRSQVYFELLDGYENLGTIWTLELDLLVD